MGHALYLPTGTPIGIVNECTSMYACSSKLLNAWSNRGSIFMRIFSSLKVQNYTRTHRLYFHTIAHITTFSSPFVDSNHFHLAPHWQPPNLYFSPASSCSAKAIFLHSPLRSVKCIGISRLPYLNSIGSLIIPTGSHFNPTKRAPTPSYTLGNTSFPPSL